MECNKEEAIRAMDIAKRKVTENDYNGAKKYAEKAQNLYPELDGLKQVLMMINVYITAGNKICGGESDWYGILGVDPLADEDIVKKQYRKLALLLHPDKNKCKGAEDAFKLVLEAWSLLSDKVKRIAYDQKRKSKEVKPRKSRKQKQPPNQPKQPPNQQKQQAKKQKQPPNQKNQPPNQQQEAPNEPKQPPNQEKQTPNQPKQPPNEPKQAPNQQKQAPNQQQQAPNQPKQPPNQPKQPPNQQKQPPNQPKQPPNQQKQPPNQEQQSPNKPKQQSPNKQKQPTNQPSSGGSRNGRGRSNKPTPKVSTFWTMCNNCCTPYEYVRVYYLNKTVRCRNCLGNFVASENHKTSTEKENRSTENQRTPTEKEKTPIATNKNANGVTSCGRDSSQTVSDGNSFQRDCSPLRMVNSNSRNATNQAEESIKRRAEGSQDGIANSGFKVEEKVFKKLKTNDYAEANGGIKV